MSGRFLDDWSVGEEFLTPGRTITETDVVMFAAMTGDYNELHTNKEFMKDSQFGERIAHGLLGLAVSHGLLFRLGLLERTAVALLGVESWQFTGPIALGDTISVRVRVNEVRPSKSKPDRGVLKLALQIVNQHGDVVQEGVKVFMMARRNGCG